MKSIFVQTVYLQTLHFFSPRRTGKWHGALSLFFLCLFSALLQAEDVPRFSIFEKSFAHTGTYTNPYTEITATATFTPDGGDPLQIPLFWNGGTEWRVRFSPNLTGPWTWLVTSADAGLNGQTGSFTCLASSNKGGIRASGYHFEHEDGTPFWWLGDTQFNLFADKDSELLNEQSVFDYIDLRASQGFNVIFANLLPFWGQGMRDDSAVLQTPFSGAPNESELLNPAFWAEADERIEKLSSCGITGGLMLAWSSHFSSLPEGMGTNQWDGNNGFTTQSKRLRYARYITARYSAYYVFFISAGEYDEALTLSEWEEIALEVRANDPHNRMITIHPAAIHSIEGHFAESDWNAMGDYQQMYSNLHYEVLDSRDHNKPVVNSEYAYYLRDKDGDGSVDKENSASLWEIRDATWDIAMAGGYFITGWGRIYYGGMRMATSTFDIHHPDDDDWEEDVQHLRTLFTGLSWWNLDPNDALLSNLGTPAYCLAHIGETYVVYLRGNLATHTLTVPPGAYSIKRFDPREGTFTPLSSQGGPSIDLTPIESADPVDSNDWIFLVEKRVHPNHNGLAVTTTFNDGTYEEWVVKKGVNQIANSAAELYTHSRLLLPSRRYTDGTILLRVGGGGLPASTWIGVVIRAEDEEHDYGATGGTQSMVFVQSSNWVKLMLSDGTIVNGSALQNTTVTEENFSMLVEAEGDQVRCWVNGELGLNYSGISNPIDGGFTSVRSHNSELIQVLYIVVRPPDFPPDITIDSAGTIWQSLLKKDLIPLDPALLLFEHSYSPSLPYRLRVRIEGLDGDHLILGASGFPMISDNEFRLSYEGLTEGEIVP